MHRVGRTGLIFASLFLLIACSDQKSAQVEKSTTALVLNATKVPETLGDLKLNTSANITHFRTWIRLKDQSPNATHNNSVRAHRSVTTNLPFQSIETVQLPLAAERLLKLVTYEEIVGILTYLKTLPPASVLETFNDQQVYDIIHHVQNMSKFLNSLNDTVLFQGLKALHSNPSLWNLAVQALNHTQVQNGTIYVETSPGTFKVWEKSQTLSRQTREVKDEEFVEGWDYEELEKALTNALQELLQSNVIVKLITPTEPEMSTVTDQNFTTTISPTDYET